MILPRPTGVLSVAVIMMVLLPGVAMAYVIGPGEDLSGADLAGIDLRFADLGSAKL